MAQQNSAAQGGGDSLAEAEAVTKELRLAFENGVLEEIRRLLPKYFDPSFPTKQMDQRFNPPTFWATKHGCLEGLVELVDKYNCGLNYVDKKSRLDLLHIACLRGNNKVIQYLAKTQEYDPHEEKNKGGSSLLFVACQRGYLDTVKLLIEDLKCDPSFKNSDGDSLLHVACIKGHLGIARYLVSSQNLDPNGQNKRQETPLHLACSSGRLEVVQYLLGELHCKTAVFDAAGLTPLHCACSNGYDGVVSYIIENDSEATHTLFDQTGSTPLHLAARNGRKEVVKALLSSGRVDPNALSLLEEAPIEIAQDKGTIKELIVGGAKPVGRTRSILQHYRDKEPLNSLVHIFVIGYELAGRSTLIKALQQPVNTKSNFLNFLNRVISPQVRDVIERTAGIVPIEFDSPDFGKVLLFDFAGQHEYHASHAALLEYSNTSSAPVFLLVVNMMEDFEEVKRKTSYWVTFILNNPVSGNRKPHVVIVGSHIDQLQRKSKKVFKENVQRVERYARGKLGEANLTYGGFFALDCRDPFKQDSLRQCLRTSCQALRTDEEIDACCHVLRVFLLDKFSEELCCTTEDVISQAKDSEYPLPIQADRLCELAQEMSTRTKTLFLRNPYEPEKSWIVLDIDVLLTKVNGRIFAPDSFHNEHVFTPSTSGILKKSELKKHFPKLDPDMLVAFLRRLEFCQVVSDSEVLEGLGNDDDIGTLLICIPANQESPNSDPPRLSSSLPPSMQHLPHPVTTHLFDRLYMRPSPTPSTEYIGLRPEDDDAFLFFPDLMTSKEPNIDLWVPDNSYSFYTGWCLECTSDDQTFGGRFLTTLHLRLAHKFAVRTMSHNSGPVCTKWKNGIRWLSFDGIETIVEVVENGKAVVLLMRAKGQGLVLKGLRLRSAIIRKILDAKEQYCAQITMSEYLIDESHLRTDHKYPVITGPLRTLTRYDMGVIAAAFLDETSQYVFSTKQVSQVLLTDVVHFDPYLGLGDKLLARLYAEDDQDKKLDQRLLYDLAQRHHANTEKFIKILLEPEAMNLSGPGPYTCMDVFVRYWETDATLAKFRKELDKYSLFAGRNIVSKRNSTHTALQSVSSSFEQFSSLPEFPRRFRLDKQPKEFVISERPTESEAVVSDLLSGSTVQSVPVLSVAATSNMSDSINPTLKTDLPEPQVSSMSTPSPTSTVIDREKEMRVGMNMSFLDPIETLVVDNKGHEYTNQNHDFTVRFPQGAIPKEQGAIQITVSISLRSPLIFPPDTRLVSPIIGLCVIREPQFRFLKPVEITLSHYLDVTDKEDANQLGLRFVKAQHNQYTFCETDGEANFELQGSCGMLKTYHFCYFCIVANKEPDPSKVNYCVVSVAPRVTVSPRWKVTFCITYFLSTCLRAVEKQFDADDVIVETVQRFRFPSSASEGNIEICFDRKITGGWYLALESSKGNDPDRINHIISANEVEFWGIDHEELQLMEEKKLYPPRFTLAILGTQAYQVGHVRICFKGTMHEQLITELLLEPIKHEACNSVTSSPSRLDSEPSHLDLMNKVACKVHPAKWRDIGLQLGLGKPELDEIEMDNPRNVNKCFSAMFYDWKRKMTSPYKWSTLIAALEAPLVCENRLGRDLTLELSTADTSSTSSNSNPSSHSNSISEDSLGVSNNSGSPLTNGAGAEILRELRTCICTRVHDSQDSILQVTETETVVQ